MITPGPSSRARSAGHGQIFVQVRARPVLARLRGIDALKVERDENEIRKQFTVTERLAIAQRIAERLQGRSGIRHDTAPAKEKFPEVAGQTRDIAAAKAGLGSGKTLEAAQKVVERGVPELVEAMDRALCQICAK